MPLPSPPPMIDFKGGAPPHWIFKMKIKRGLGVKKDKITIKADRQYSLIDIKTTIVLI